MFATIFWLITIYKNSRSSREQKKPQRTSSSSRDLGTPPRKIVCVGFSLLHFSSVRLRLNCVGDKSYVFTVQQLISTGSKLTQSSKQQ